MDVEGIILVLSCKKHRYGRLKNINLKSEYNGWKVIKVIGNLFLEKEYEFIDDILFIRCEDSYLHLLKKLALSLKYLYKHFNIKQGVLRCGDDLIFNEQILVNFLKSEKYDFFGQSPNPALAIRDKALLKNMKFNTQYDDFMLNYYLVHRNELIDKEHGINMSIEDLNKYLVRPYLNGPAGVLYYISNHSCKVIIDTLENINYNIFHLDEYTNSYPYIIEDTAVTYIMYRNEIPYTDSRIFYNNYYYNDQVIATHTNIAKYDVAQ
jgi:hypothetical protein